MTSRRQFLLLVAGLATAACQPAAPAGSAVRRISLAEQASVPFAWDPPTGIAIRFIRAYDVTKDRYPTALDTFVVQPELRMSG